MAAESGDAGLAEGSTIDEEIPGEAALASAADAEVAPEAALEAEMPAEAPAPALAPVAQPEEAPVADAPVEAALDAEALTAEAGRPRNLGAARRRRSRRRAEGEGIPPSPVVAALAAGTSAPEDADPFHLHGELEDPLAGQEQGWMTPHAALDHSRLWAEGLCKQYRGRKVVDGVGLTISPGEVVGLLGPNGAGKTTTFYMIVGLIPVDQGKIYLDGLDVSHEPMYRRARLGVSYLPQEPSVFRGMTVRDNILAILETLSLTRDQRLERLEELMGDLGISHLFRTMGFALSGGERRRVEVARALAIEPRYILLDEPFAGVDPLAVGDIKNIIRQLRKRGIGILITDHNVRETLTICNRAYIMNAGRILAEGPPRKVIADARVRKMYLGDDFRL